MGNNPTDKKAKQKVIDIRDYTVEDPQLYDDKYYIAYKNFPLSYQSLDENGDFIDINSKWSYVLGYSREEVIGRNFSEFLCEGFREVFLEKFPQFKAKGEICNLPYKMIKKDGTHIFVEFSGKVGYDESGDFKQTHCVFQDITDRMKAEEAVLDLKEFYQKILDGIVTGVWVSDKDDVIFYANRGIGDIAGIDVGDIENVNVLNDFPETTLQDFRPYFLKAKQTLGICYYDSVSVITPAGRQSYQSGWLIPLIKGKAYDGMICTVEDITARKKAEEEKQGLWHQLLQSQKMDSIGQMTGVMAHDFRSVLLTVIGFSDIALAELEEWHPARDYLERIKRVGENAVDLIRNLLVFSRKQDLNLAVHNINSMINGMTDLLSTVTGSGVRLDISTKAPTGDALIDAVQIEQALMNLMLNARDAMDGTGTLTIETGNVSLSVDDPECKCYKDEKPGDFILISVTDSGRGMSQEVQDKVFEPFFTTKESGNGNGLGLSTVYGVVKQHNGCIRVKSAVDKGATFEIFLPVHK